MTINKHSIEFDFITDEEEILTFPRISKAENSGEGIQVIFTMIGFFSFSWRMKQVSDTFLRISV
jgi:hypothetical protein